MAQSQLTHQDYLAGLKFHSISSILTWAGSTLAMYLDGDKSLPYVEKSGTWYYFGLYPEREYRLVCTATKDIGAEQ